MKPASIVKSVAVAVACAAVLVACGGGGGGSNPIPTGGGGGSTPTPTLAPTPTPTPAPGADATLAPYEFASVSHPGWKFWGPWSVANAFRFPVQSGFAGSGQTIAIVIDATPVQADIDAFLAYFHIVRTGTITFRAVAGGGAPDTSTGGEATLDTEEIAGIAPGANVVVYDIPDLSDPHILAAYNAILADGTAKIVNLSFGGCEYAGSKTVANPIFNSMNAAGIAVSVAAGDTGNDCYQDGTTFPFGPQSPATDPNVIGVGGTATSPSTDTILSSAIWNDCPGSTFGDNCLSGGGVSAFFATPSYQVGLGGATQTGRNVPDISLPGSNAAIRLAAQWYVVGGTSYSAPLNAGLLAEVYQYCNTTSIPNSVRMFYDTFAATGYASFSDVTAGNDLYINSPGPSYTAAVGYDNVGGIGQPYGMAVAQHICPGRSLIPLNASVRTSATVSQLPAEARSYDNLRDLRNVRGLTDMGDRSASAPTQVSILLRATATIHSDETSVVSRLREAGFSITQQYSNAMLVEAEAPASTVARYFGTSLHDYMQAGRGTRFANVTTLTIPAAIAAYVQGIVSDDLVTASHGPLRLTPLFLGGPKTS